MRPRAISAHLAALSTVFALALASGFAHAGPPLAPLPGTNGAPAATGPATPPQPTPNLSPAERLSRGIVTVERDGRVIAAGAVLSGGGEGRILTALSPLATADAADVRYADGSVVHAKVTHRDRAWDLALLVPIGGTWVDGLMPSSANAMDTSLHVPVAVQPGRPVLVGARVRGLTEARSKEGNTMLPAVLDVDVQSPTPTLGAPLTDPSGGIVGILVRACQATLPVVASPNPKAAPPPPPPCIPIVVGVGVVPIEEFFAHPSDAPWLGIHGVPDTESNTRGVRVVEVAADSPAEKAGLKGGEDHTQADLIVAVDAQPVSTPEQLADIISRHAIGEHVKLLLLLGGKFHDAVVVLRAAP